MIRYLIKNYMKIMFRSKWSIALLVVGPVLVIAVLSSAFADLMKSYEGVDEFRVGYRIEEGSIYENFKDTLLDAGRDAGIMFTCYDEGDTKQLMENNDLAGFVILGKEEYTVYRSGDYTVEGMTLEYFMNRVTKECENGILTSTMPVQEACEEVLPVENIEYMPAIDATDYYGIVYVVYFCWCGIVCATNILTSEKKYGIERRFRVSAISNTKMYISKLVPIVLVVSAGMAVATVTTTLMYGIHWGNPALSAFIIFMTILASSAYGLMLYSFSENVAITVIVLFTSVWFMGYFGGSFETYMFANTKPILKMLSPLYYSNRSLVELSCMGHSSYTGSCILYMLLITVGCSILALGANMLRKRGK